MATTPETTVAVTHPTPVGRLTLVASGRGLRAVLWEGDGPARARLTAAALRETDESDAVLDETRHQLDAYFAGTRTSFDLPLDLQGTPLQLAAWHALAKIPFGETRTYAEQAAMLGRPNAFRAVGAANGRNPLSIVLPCHRVVGSDGSLKGFAGGIETKRWLLEHELSCKRASLREARKPARAGSCRARTSCSREPTVPCEPSLPSAGALRLRSPVALGGESAVP